MSAYENSYWEQKGKYQALADKLAKRVPQSGPCPPQFPKLDRFRRASNCYYDLFNNGLCNRNEEFRALFGFGVKRRFAAPRFRYREIDFKNEEMNTLLNAAMDKFILEAAVEQLSI